LAADLRERQIARFAIPLAIALSESLISSQAAARPKMVSMTPEITLLMHLPN
jgi:hypothetical protein